MKVKELIKILKTKDQNSLVLLDTEGYPLQLNNIKDDEYAKEYDIDSLKEVKTITLISQ
jgi:hypothetical protein